MRTSIVEAKSNELHSSPSSVGLEGRTFFPKRAIVSKSGKTTAARNIPTLNSTQNLCIIYQANLRQSAKKTKKRVHQKSDRDTQIDWIWKILCPQKQDITKKWAVEIVRCCHLRLSIRDECQMQIFASARIVCFVFGRPPKPAGSSQVRHDRITRPCAVEGFPRLRRQSFPSWRNPKHPLSFSFVTLTSSASLIETQSVYFFCCCPSIRKQASSCWGARWEVRKKGGTNVINELSPDTIIAKQECKTSVQLITRWLHWKWVAFCVR